jgi:hypothetical protein
MAGHEDLAHDMPTFAQASSDATEPVGDRLERVVQRNTERL